MNDLDEPSPPFLWFGLDPDDEMPRRYGIPVTAIAFEAKGISGVISSPSGPAIDLLTRWIEGPRSELAPSARVVVAVYPTCGTTEADLEQLRALARRRAATTEFRVRAFGRVTDRPTTVMCFVDRASDDVTMLLAPENNLGFDTADDGRVSLVCRPDAAVVASYRDFFDALWAESRDILDTDLPTLPALRLPPGTPEAAETWAAFQGAWCPDREEAGTESPSAEAGLTSDELAVWVGSIYSKGEMVAIDKASRLPPLDAPLDPAWFGDVAAMQRGTVTRKVSLRISVFDEGTLKGIEKHRQGLRELLKWFTFGLADGIRWMPRSARPLFEAEVERINEEGRGLISSLLKKDVRMFLQQRKSALANDLQAMFQDRGAEMPSFVLDSVLSRLDTRLSKAQSANLLPLVSFSPVGFGTYTSQSTNPWAQAWALLSDIAAFPRKLMADPFFVRGLTVSEATLLPAMDVAHEDLASTAATVAVRERWKDELRLLGEIDKSSLEARKRCELARALLTGSDLEDIREELQRGSQ